MNFLKSNSGGHFVEHHGWYYQDEMIKPEVLPILPDSISYMGRKESTCFSINVSDRKVCTGYYVGVDWLIKDELAVCVQPKINHAGRQVNYLKMLFDALKHHEVRQHSNALFELKTEEPFIEIEEQQDLITPLLVLHFLQIVKDIVRKGLKKGYYRTEQKLYARVKGKVLVTKTIKENLLKNKPLYTTCAYDNFGVDIPENRLLKKALAFTSKYLANLNIPGANLYLTETYHFIAPAFEAVCEDMGSFETKHFKPNPFYKEYKEAIELARLILKRFGYNITNANSQKKATIPPFWIDMSKLFELYVLGQLKKKYGSGVLYGNKDAKGTYGLPDFLIKAEGIRMIVDTKYKPKYSNDKNINDKIIEDIRQLSGYGRDKGVLTKLGYLTETEQSSVVVKCLIVYPDQSVDESLFNNAQSPIEGFVEFYKMPVRLPEI